MRRKQIKKLPIDKHNKITIEIHAKIAQTNKRIIQDWHQKTIWVDVVRHVIFFRIGPQQTWQFTMICLDIILRATCVCGAVVASFFFVVSPFLVFPVVCTFTGICRYIGVSRKSAQRLSSIIHHTQIGWWSIKCLVIYIHSTRAYHQYAPVSYIYP